MTRSAAIIASCVLLSVASACEGGEEPAPDPSAEVDEMDATTSVRPEQRPETMTSGPALSVDSLDGMAYLTDAGGRALYVLEGEPADSSTCYDACAEAWPPFLAGQGDPEAEAAGVRSELVGTLARRGGERQVTYAGHALYYYREDAGPGQATGQDVTDQWGEWYLLQPSGELLERH